MCHLQKGKSVVFWKLLVLEVEYLRKTCLDGIIIIIIIKNEKIKVTLCKNAEGALCIVSKMCVDGQRKVQGWNKLMMMSIVTRAEEECLQFMIKRR